MTPSDKDIWSKSVRGREEAENFQCLIPRSSLTVSVFSARCSFDERQKKGQEGLDWTEYLYELRQPVFA